MANSTKPNDELILPYLESQAFGYLLAGISFIIDFQTYNILVALGWMFIFVALFCIIAPVCMKNLALRLNRWFRSGLFMATSALILLDGWLGSVKANNDVLFWVLVVWTLILILVNAYSASKRLGIFRLIAFFLAAFGLITIALGHGIWAQIIAVIGIILSIPVLNETMYENWRK
jgi:hypothetical protein